MLPAVLLFTACKKEGEAVNKKEKEYGAMSVIDTPEPTPTRSPEEIDLEIEDKNERAYEDTDEGMAETALIRRSTFCYFYETGTEDLLETAIKAGYAKEEVSDISGDISVLVIPDDKAIMGDIVYNAHANSAYGDMALYIGQNEVVCEKDGQRVVCMIHQFADDFSFLRILPDDASTEEARKEEIKQFGYLAPFTVELTEGQKTLLGNHEDALGALFADHYSKVYGTTEITSIEIKNLDSTSFQGIYTIDIIHPSGQKTVYYFPDRQEFSLNP